MQYKNKICIILMLRKKESLWYINNFKKSFDKNVKIYFKYWYDKNLISFIKKNNISGIILSGSSDRVLDKTHKIAKIPHKLLNLNIPILGICYGFQYLAKILSGDKCIATFKTVNDKIKKYDKILSIYKPFIIKNIKYKFKHYDYVRCIPKNWIKILSYKKQIWMAYDKKRKIIGTQFHPEKYKLSRKMFFSNWIEYISKS